MHDGANGVNDPTASRSRGAKRKGVPLSSIVKGFAAGKKHPAVRAVFLVLLTHFISRLTLTRKERLTHVKSTSQKEEAIVAYPLAGVLFRLAPNLCWHTTLPSQVPCGVSSEQSSKSLEAFAWGDNAAGCLGLPMETSAALTPRVLEPWGFLPGERVVAVACSER